MSDWYERYQSGFYQEIYKRLLQTSNDWNWYYENQTLRGA